MDIAKSIFNQSCTKYPGNICTLLIFLLKRIYAKHNFRRGRLYISPSIARNVYAEKTGECMWNKNSRRGNWESNVWYVRAVPSGFTGGMRSRKARHISAREDAESAARTWFQLNFRITSRHWEQMFCRAKGVRSSVFAYSCRRFRDSAWTRLETCQAEERRGACA